METGMRKLYYISLKKNERSSSLDLTRIGLFSILRM